MASSAAEELGPPDSWELADLEESVSRLMISAKKTDPILGFVEDTGPGDSSAFVAASAAATCAGSPSHSSSGSATTPFPSDGNRRPSEELISRVDQFLREALEKPRERLSILRMEQDIERFIRDPRQQQLELQGLPTSYLRLAAHRIAQHYYLQSVALPDSLPDGSGSRIVLIKTAECRFPPIRLADIPVNLPQGSDHNMVKLAIKQRPQRRLQTVSSAGSHFSKSNHLKSVEERKEEYNRARARIFSGNISSGSGSTLECEPNLSDSLGNFTPGSRQTEDILVGAVSDFNADRYLGESSTISSRSVGGRVEKENTVSRNKTGNKVAIFRDREVDRKDPDYDRSYDRYMQRFDPGFGFTGGPFTIQPIYSPVVNYNTEFPQLRSAGPVQNPQMSIDDQSQIPMNLHPSWGSASSPTSLGYGPPDSMMPGFCTNHVSLHSPSSMYLHSSQYLAQPRPGVAQPRPRVAFVHTHEQVRRSAQTQQPQHETSFELARPQ